MSWYPQLDSKALEQAILRELSRQGVEFAQVNYDPFTLSEKIVHIHLHTEDRLNPKYVERCRVSNQIVPSKLSHDSKNFNTQFNENCNDLPIPMCY